MVLVGGLALLSAALTLLYLLRSSSRPQLSHLTVLSEPALAWPGCASSTPPDCPVDPFRRPGMIYWGGGASETRWLPFPPSLASEPQFASMETLDRSGELSERDMDELGAPERLMPEMARGGGAWARGKSVLFIGDSHDRNNVYHFCDAVGGRYNSWGDHTGGWCRVDRLELTLAVWFLYGLPDQDYPWHAPNEPRPKTAGGRITEVFLPRMAADGMGNFTPDLVVMSSLFWDSDHMFEGYFSEFAVQRPAQHGLSFHELRFHQQQAALLISQIRAQYTPQVPLMYRSRHLRANNDGGRMLRVTQMDQGWRAVCERAGVRVFDWGSKLEGYTDYYDGQQHFAAPGPATWLFGDMMLYYLRQAMDVERWWACFQP
ncbi:hypothetical protein CALCODRAFT_498347 [Calocera cornea HHB12733]|uniref:Uncharacterized protein n=1 Tax=Calocera cornea HHB12733 TaxID=1353952 RepID=A0A165EVM2_9BASI|nr:hypothetical protein CALCODRAFT_498347 [Calocera cornea HHB12733]